MNEQHHHINSMHLNSNNRHPRSTHVKIPLNYHGSVCCYCHIKLDKRNFTREHVIPKSKGGTWIEACCKECNREKADMSLFDYIEFLEYKMKTTVVEWEIDFLNKKINNAKSLPNRIISQLKQIEMSDQKTISNEQHEIKSAARIKGVELLTIHLAKYFTGSNDRDVIYKWIDENKGYHVQVEVK